MTLWSLALTQVGGTLQKSNASFYGVFQKKALIYLQNIKNNLTFCVLTETSKWMWRFEYATFAFPLLLLSIFDRITFYLWNLFVNERIMLFKKFLKVRKRRWEAKSGENEREGKLGFLKAIFLLKEKEHLRYLKTKG